MKKLKIGVLISGSGTNLQAIIESCKISSYPVEIAVVISNKKDAYGLVRAKSNNIPAYVISHKDYNTREDFDNQVSRVLESYKVELVCMAGFMRILSESFVDKWYNKLINIHPSLLPSFKGADAKKQALDCGVKITGCTVHFVRKEVDTGPIILQAAYPIISGDTVESIRERGLPYEHRCYIEAIRLIAEGRVENFN